MYKIENNELEKVAGGATSEWIMSNIVFDTGIGYAGTLIFDNKGAALKYVDANGVLFYSLDHEVIH